MKTVLCYGDSNTWGFDPATQNRFPRDVRWTGVLRNSLGPEYLVIEEGLNGRTTVWSDPIEGEYKSGKTYLVPCLESHAPLDLVVLMLGTNDLKMRFSVTPFDICSGIEVLVKIIRASMAGPDGGAPEILLVAPPPVARLSNYAEMFEGAGPKSKRLGEHYRELAGLYGCAFLDAGQVIVSSDIDGIHFEAGEHGKLGRAVAEQVKLVCGA